MNRIISLTAVFLLLFAAGYSDNAFSKNNLKWHSFNKALELSRSLKKPLVVDFYADWCSWCKEMDKKTFADPGISKILAKDFVLARIDVEKKQTIEFKGKSYSTKEFQALLRVTGLPTLAFFDKSGELITTLPGFVTAVQFKPILGYISSECYAKQIKFDEYKTTEKCEK